MGKRKARLAVERPYRNDYGLWMGHCKSRESALVAAFRNMVLRHYTHVTVEGPDGEAIARLRRTAKGLSIWAPDSHPGVNPSTKRKAK